MTTRIGLVAGALLLAAVALWHPAPRPAFQSAAPASPSAKFSDDARGRHGRGVRGRVGPVDAVVYVAGAVRRPGLYHVRVGERAADAIARAGGLSAAADAGGVNLAAHAGDGDEIYVSTVGEAGARRPGSYGSPRRRNGGRRARSTYANEAIPPAGVDVNAADAESLARVPGIGRSIAARIVELRERDGAFASLDELLDVSGMTQTRLERARPFLQPSP
ncbi:MAG: helix-hairpin-helix domain-containing protein [Candidatus Tumulicola sp.]